MRAAVLAAPGTVEIVSTQVPEPGAGQVRVRLEGSGVCGSNLPAWEGRPWFDYPLAPGAPGHEGWGYVDALGEALHGPAVGTRVAFLSSHAYAECDLVRADELVMLPPALDGKPFPGEALGCAMNIFRRSGVREAETVAIVGIGFLGALLTRLASSAGARVIAVSRRRSALEVARQFGADEVVSSVDFEAAARRVLSFAPDGCDCVIEAVGMQPALDLATQLTRVRGRLVIAGYHQDGLRTVDMQLWNWRGLDVVNAHERDSGVYVEGIRAAVDAVATGRLDPTPLYTDTFALDAAGQAFAKLAERPDGFLKALVTA
jgi:threonine dehydrogenase-like Zn-dependent dehydrogenase